MEKYNTQESNPLDVGADHKDDIKPESLKVSPEVEKIIMQKVKDIFEYGQAITGIGAKAKSIHIWNDRMEIRKNRENVTLSPNNIREYFSSDEDTGGESVGISMIIDGVFRYGVQTLASTVDENNNLVKSYIAKSYSEYRKKTKNENQQMNESNASHTANWDGVFFQVEGRSQDIRNEYNGIRSGGGRTYV